MSALAPRTLFTTSRSWIGNRRRIISLRHAVRREVKHYGVTSATNTAVVAEATVLRLGRALGFAQVRLLTDAPERQLVANVTGSYSIPPAS
jgi:hypothetical protein